MKTSVVLVVSLQGSEPKDCRFKTALKIFKTFSFYFFMGWKFISDFLLLRNVLDFILKCFTNLSLAIIKTEKV